MEEEEGKGEEEEEEEAEEEGEEEAEDDDEESSVWRFSRCRRRSCQVSRNSGSGTFQGMYEIR